MDQHDHAWLPPSIATARLWALEDMAASVRTRPRRRRLAPVAARLGRGLTRLLGLATSQLMTAIDARRAHRRARVHWAAPVGGRP